MLNYILYGIKNIICMKVLKIALALYIFKIYINVKLLGDDYLEDLNKILVSTGSLSKYPYYTKPEEIADNIRNVNWDNFELLIYKWDDIDKASEILLNSGKNFKVVHSEKRIGSGFGSSDINLLRLAEERFKKDVDLSCNIGAKFMNLHLWDLPDSDKNLDRNIDALKENIGYADEKGICITIETILGYKNKPTVNIRNVLHKLLSENVKVKVTYDIEFLYRMNCLDEAVNDRELIKNAADFHIRGCDSNPFNKDGKRRYLNLTEGKLDIRSYVQKMKSNNYSGFYTIESSYIDTEGRKYFDKLDKDLKYLKSMFD